MPSGARLLLGGVRRAALAGSLRRVGPGVRRPPLRLPTRGRALDGHRASAARRRLCAPSGRRSRLRPWRGSGRGASRQRAPAGGAACGRGGVTATLHRRPHPARRPRRRDQRHSGVASLSPWRWLEPARGRWYGRLSARRPGLSFPRRVTTAPRHRRGPRHRCSRRRLRRRRAAHLHGRRRHAPRPGHLACPARRRRWSNYPAHRRTTALLTTALPTTALLTTARLTTALLTTARLTTARLA
jgi:hypothetical protein